MLTGGKFNLNVLKLGQEKETMKALLKPFKPGENRFGMGCARVCVSERV